MPMMSIPFSVGAPTMAQIFVVPMSRPTTISPDFCFPMNSSRWFARVDASLSRRAAFLVSQGICKLHRDPSRPRSVFQMDDLAHQPSLLELCTHLLQA